MTGETKAEAMRRMAHELGDVAERMLREAGFPARPLVMCDEEWLMLSVSLDEGGHGARL